MVDHAATVTNTLDFAQLRLNDLKTLKESNKGFIGHANPAERQILVEEFFFHLVSAIDKLMYHINKSKSLGLQNYNVSAYQICRRLKSTDPIKPIIHLIHPETRTRDGWIPLPEDSYSEEASFFRIMVFRHWVNHSGTNPFALRVGSEPSCSLFLDPRETVEGETDSRFKLGSSARDVIDEMQYFHDLVKAKCDKVMELLASSLV